MLFTSKVLLPVLTVSVDPSTLVYTASPAVAFGVDPLMFVIVVYHHIADSERKFLGSSSLCGSRYFSSIIDSVIYPFDESSSFFFRKEYWNHKKNMESLMK